MKEGLYLAGFKDGQTLALEPFRQLFNGGPDTACRTTWRDEGLPARYGVPRTECVEVPLDELRAAFDKAEKL